MTSPREIGQRARVLLAAELFEPYASLIRAGRSMGPARVTEDQALAAIEAALRSTGREGWVKAAAGYTLDSAGNPFSVRDENGQTIEHAAWMLQEIVWGHVTGDKAHRWLGYAQAILVMAGFLTLEEAKLANKRASDESAPPVSDTGERG